MGNGFEFMARLKIRRKRILDYLKVRNLPYPGTVEFKESRNINVILQVKNRHNRDEYFCLKCFDRRFGQVDDEDNEWARNQALTLCNKYDIGVRKWDDL